jgi:hypothetical protein
MGMILYAAFSPFLVYLRTLWFDFILIFWHANRMRAAGLNPDLSPVKQKRLGDRIAITATLQNYSDSIIL